METDLHISERKTCWEMLSTTQSKDGAGENTQKGLCKKRLFQVQALCPASPNTLSPFSGKHLIPFLFRTCASLEVPRYFPGFSLLLGLVQTAGLHGSFIHSQALIESIGRS